MGKMVNNFDKILTNMNEEGYIPHDCRTLISHRSSYNLSYKSCRTVSICNYLKNWSSFFKMIANGGSPTDLLDNVSIHRYIIWRFERLQLWYYGCLVRMLLDRIAK